MISKWGLLRHHFPFDILESRKIIPGSVSLFWAPQRSDWDVEF